MTTPKPGILRNLRVKRVDLVDAGANFDAATGDGAHIMLYKSAPSLGQVHVDVPIGDERDDYEKATLDSSDRNSLPDSAFAAVWTDSAGKHRKLPIHDAGHLAAARGRIDQADIPADVKAAARRKMDAKTLNKKENVVDKNFLKRLVGLFKETDVAKRDKEIDDLATSLDAVADDKKVVEKKTDKTADKQVHKAKFGALRDHLQKAMDECGPGPYADDHPIHAMKALFDSTADPDGDAQDSEPDGGVAKGKGKETKMDAEVAKRMTDLEKRAVAAEAAVEVEKNIRLDREMVDVLKSFRATPFDLVKDVPEFRKMKETSPAAFERTIALLKATDAQLADSVIYKNIGSSASAGGNDAWAQIEAKADSMVEKSTTGITREQAIEKVMLANPKLVNQYRAGQQ